MTKKANKTEPTIHVYFHLDRSGSMEKIRDDVIGGFNSFVEEQKKVSGKCLLTLVQFDSDDAYDITCDAQPIEKVAPLTLETFVPRGFTPLYDAMGRGIANAVIRQDALRGKGKQEEKVLFITFTDGLENNSREYTREKVFQAIAKRKEDGWTFVYLGANQDAYLEGGSVGYNFNATANYHATPEGTRRALKSVSASTLAYRSRGGTDSNNSFFTDVAVQEKTSSPEKDKVSSSK